MPECPLCETHIPDAEMFDHVSDHGHAVVVAWVVDQAS